MTSVAGQARLSTPFIHVTAFLDWNAQIRGFGLSPIVDPISRAKQTLERSTRAISRFLIQRDQAARFQVRLRLYHGWYKGFEPSPNRRAITAVIGGIDFATLSRYPKVTFNPDVLYGDYLLDALPERCHANPVIHLANTLRQQDRGEDLVEKMVDTALASDLLSWARSSPDEWALVLGDDDDLVPPLFVAEAWTKPHGGRTMLLRHRPGSRTFLKLDSLLAEIPK